MNWEKNIPPHQVERQWFLVDAEGKILGRLATQIATILRGKHRPYFTPHWDLGDYVVVINAAKIKVTGGKEKKKIYYRHTGYPGGLKEETLGSLRQRKPEEVIYRAVKGMLPKNRLARKIIKKLYIFPGKKHPFKGKNFVPLD